MSPPQAMRAAGSTSRSNPFSLDGHKPFAGLIGDIQAAQTPSRSWKSRSAERILDHGDGTYSTGWPSRSVRTPHMTGGVPRHGVMKQQVGIPGYCGHVAGKVTENLHGGSFSEENERAALALPAREKLFQSLSSPELYRSTLSDSGSSSDGSPKKGYNVAPRVPGFSGHVPGKLAESVYGLRVADANSTANALRQSNPHADSQCWLRKGVWPADRQMMYKFKTGRVATVALQDHFSNAEQAAAMEGSKRMGHTFGMRPPSESLFKPGDRYLNAGAAVHKTRRVDPSSMQPAGQSSHSPLLDGQRWKLHHMINVTCVGNPRVAY